jgi:UDP-N-acetylmuramoyl-tripeptide--D-alanyl-D-alanine ligase
MQVIDLNGLRIINDAYNANVDSMIAALETLSQFPAGAAGSLSSAIWPNSERTVRSARGSRTKIAELGEIQLVAVGKMASLTAQAAREAGLRDVMECRDVAEGTVALKKIAREGDVILLKASRVIGLERISESLGQCCIT